MAEAKKTKEKAPVSEPEDVKLVQTPQEVLDDDGGLPQPSQDPNVVIESDEGAEG